MSELDANEADDDDQASCRSIDLLAQTPPKTKVVHGRASKRSRDDEDSDGSSVNSQVFSPATKTLNQLSQQSETVDLHNYDDDMGENENDKESNAFEEAFQLQKEDPQPNSSTVDPNTLHKNHEPTENNEGRASSLRAPEELSDVENAVDGADGVPRKTLDREKDPVPFKKAVSETLDSQAASERNKNKGDASMDQKGNLRQNDDKDDSEEFDGESTQSDSVILYEFEGVQYETYEEMVNAKRQRNQNVLAKFGLLDMPLTTKNKKPKTAKAKKDPPQEGTRRSKRAKSMQDTRAAAAAAAAATVSTNLSSEKTNKSNESSAVRQPKHGKKANGRKVTKTNAQSADGCKKTRSSKRVAGKSTGSSVAAKRSRLSVSSGQDQGAGSSSTAQHVVVTSCGDDDVLFGRVGKNSNKKYRALIQTQFGNYVKASGREAKRLIFQQVVDEVKRRGGKFLTKEESGFVVEHDHDAIVQKVQRSFKYLEGLMDSGESQRHNQEFVESQLTKEGEAEVESFAVPQPKSHKASLISAHAGIGRAVRDFEPGDAIGCSTSRRTRASWSEARAQAATPQEAQHPPSLESTEASDNGQDAPNGDLSISHFAEFPASKETLCATIGQYEIHRICIEFEPPLNMTMVRFKEPSESLRDCLSEDLKLEKNFEFVRVDSVSPDSQCNALGIQKGDWIVEYRENHEGKMLLVPYHYKAFKSLVTKAERPIFFSIARKISESGSYHVSGDGETYEHVQSQNQTSPTRSSRHSPFCFKCKHPQRKEAIHHPWCMKNAHFSHSGAEYIVRRLNFGRKIGCSRCCSEFETGRVAESLQHSDDCLEHISQLQQEKLETKQQTRRSQSSRQQDSFIQPATDSTAPTMTTHADDSFVHEAGTKVSKQSESPKTGALSDDSRPPSLDEEESECDSLGSFTEGDDLATDWVRSSNPWGREEMDDQDVVLFANFRGVGHPEILFHSSRRFTMHPFESSNAESRYSITHHSPSDGFQALVLKRDVLCTRPWGFSVYRHEFGAACLVESVDPLGPARAATLMGSQKSCGLRTHDMIIQANGKTVGGMKEACLSLELDLAGPELVLLVSRYKFPHDSDETAKETQSILNVDSTMRDKRLLEWTQCDERQPPPYERDPVSIRLGKSANDEKGTTETLSAPTQPAAPKTSTAFSRTEVDTDNADNVANVVVEEASPAAKPTTNEVDSPSRSTEENSVASEPDDGNAWMGCICGKTHSKLPVFWLQCDSCFSWYNLHHGCVGFSEEEARAMKTWPCGCTGPVETDDGGKLLAGQGDKEHSIGHEETLHDDAHPEPTADAGTHVRRHARAASSDVQAFPVDREEAVPENSIGTARSPTPKDETAVVAAPPKMDEEDESAHLPKPIPDGTVVSIQEHAWAGVNNPHGIAKVVRSKIDDDGMLLYDIWYIIDKRLRSVEEQFVSIHEF